MVKKIGQTKVTRNFQITINEDARKFFMVSPGDYVIFVWDEETHKVYIQVADIVPRETEKSALPPS